MPKANKPITEISVIVAPEGHSIIYQGYYNQTLVILREHVPRFLDNPNNAAMLVIPPFAAAALACYTEQATVQSITIDQDLALGDDFVLKIKLKLGDTIAYFSDPESILGPRRLANLGVQVAITPMMIVAVHPSDSTPQLSVVASIPQAEKPNYPRRFAADPLALREALQTTINHTKQTLRYEN